jgi:hypothetical protein
MVFDLHRQTLDGRVEVRALGHGPTFQHAAQFQAEVIVEM